MKRFYVSLGLLLALFGISLIHAWYVQDLSEELTMSLNAAETLSKRGAWDQALLVTEQALENWNANHAYLHIFMRHNDTDEILIGFQTVLEYLSLEEMDQYAAANRDLITQIDLLAGMEQPNWLNVL